MRVWQYKTKGAMKHTDTTIDDSLAMVRAAWQRVRAQYLDLLTKQTAGQPADWASLAQSFIDMNMALEATRTATSRPAPLDEHEGGG